MARTRRGNVTIYYDSNNNKILTPREARRKKAREEEKGNGKGSIRHRNKRT